MKRSLHPALSGLFSFLLLLTINLVVMKLAGKGWAANWSWAAVTAPLWGTLGAMVGLALLWLALIWFLKRFG